MNLWQEMATAPRDSTRVQVLLPGGVIQEDAHYARDLSGEEQPPFEGWFAPVLNSDGSVNFYKGIDTPIAWKPRVQ